VRLASLAAAAAILALAGCGGASSPAPPSHLHLTAFERRGRTLFISTCGMCHTLADARTGGTVGPALDSPWLASRVRETIADGPGAMPEQLLTGEQAAEVAAYVAAATK
jgi:mono/diheme cytochrome c family protein